MLRKTCRIIILQSGISKSSQVRNHIEPSIVCALGILVFFVDKFVSPEYIYIYRRKKPTKGPHRYNNRDLPPLPWSAFLPDGHVIALAAAIIATWQKLLIDYFWPRHAARAARRMCIYAYADINALTNN